VKSPALFGYFRPRLLLPEGTLEKLNHTELAYIFMHELGHLKHHDLGISWLLSIMQIIHWFNPLVWLAFYQTRVDQETACDASVLSRLDHSRSTDYANAIIGFLEKFRQNRPLPALAGILETKSQTKRRIVMITDYKSFSRKKTVVAFALLICFCFISLTLSCVSGVSGEKTVDTKRVYNLQEPDTPPSPIRRVDAIYPFEAKTQKIEGRVVVDFVVTEEGTVRDVSVVKSSPEAVFDQAAIKAIKQWKFDPGKIGGKPVETRVRTPFVFEYSQVPTVPDN
jgi:TonB family protein